MLNELVAQSRTDEVARNAHHPARLAEHELGLSRRRAGPTGATRTTRSRVLVRAVRAGLPAATAWLAALVAVVS